ncbi:hypothetical protein [Actinomadura napierensis]|uniref:Phospholipid carrier-dependent glycosyltransferase n=1 Tax=Actinomadura napierensis TaxID=267854 RepID=A0ABN3AGU2_9ACTN
MLSPQIRRRLKAGPVRAAVAGNRLFSVLLVAGLALRVFVVLGYPPALWFNDSYDFLRIADGPFPHPLRPSGYGLFLWGLKPFHSLALVTGLQHTAILGIAVVGYVALVRNFEVRRWVAALAVAPLLLDAYQAELEHLILSDTVFTVLILVAMLLLARPGAAGWRRAALVGALLGVAAVTRTVGVPLFLIALLYLLLRRTRWTSFAVLAAAFVLPLGGYAAWFHSDYGRFGMTGVDGIFLWGRTSTFADCDRHTPPPELAHLCPYGSPDGRPAASHQIWVENSPTGWVDGKPFDEKTNEQAQEFALWAIRTQPLGYVKAVSYDFFVRTFSWKRHHYPTPGTEARYHFPMRAQEQKPLPLIGGGDRISVVRDYERGSGKTHIVAPFAGWLRAYQDHVYVRGSMLGAVLLAGLAGLLRRRRARRETALLWATAVTLLAIPPVTVDFDYRYMLPAMPFACFAAALAWGRRRAVEAEPDGAKASPAEPEEAEVQPAGA